MALGGIPYYLKYIDGNQSAEQNIQQIFFTPQSPLKDEFTKLFDSLFDKADSYKAIIRIVARKKVVSLNRYWRRNKTIWWAVNTTAK